jgi:phenylacetate-coenzyme A ligase PaaK-like adenylate-forming protein
VTEFVRPHEAVDYDALTAQLPPPPGYLQTAYLDAPEIIAAKQLERLRSRAQAAYQVPFFRKRWDEVRFSPDSIQGPRT